MSTEDVHDAQVTTGGDVAAAALRVYYTSSSTVTPVHAGPSTSTTKVGELAKHSAVSISCQTRGQTRTGPYGTSDLWDKIGNGRYVPDCYVYTGADGQIAPSC